MAAAGGVRPRSACCCLIRRWGSSRGGGDRGEPCGRGTGDPGFCVHRARRNRCLQESGPLFLMPRNGNHSAPTSKTAYELGHSLGETNLAGLDGLILLLDACHAGAGVRDVIKAGLDLKDQPRLALLGHRSASGPQRLLSRVAGYPDGERAAGPVGRLPQH